MSEVLAQISGPVLASFHHMFAKSEADFQAVLLGSVIVKKYNENSDLASSTEKSKVRVVVQGWVIVSMDEVINLKSGELNKHALKSIVESEKLKFVGFLKFKKAMKGDSAPSFLDRKVMAAVLSACSWSNPSPHLYMMVGEELTVKTLSIKYSLTTLLLERNIDSDEIWSKRIPLVVPNLGSDQRQQYMQAGGGNSLALKEIVEGTELIEMMSCLVDVDKTFQPLSSRFRADMGLMSDRVMGLEAVRTILDKEVKLLKERIDSKLNMSKSMLVIRGLQSNLRFALKVAWDQVEATDINRNTLDRGEENMNIDSDLEKLKLEMSLRLELSEDEFSTP